ncbi:hypothetical protein Tco_1347906 [Tanacetum coccineum]
MFDEYYNPPTIAVSPFQEANAPRAEVLADSPMSTSIDQDAPSISIPSSQEQEHSLIISQGTDSANITRKQSNPDKHGHENGKECTRAGDLIDEGSSK